LLVWLQGSPLGELMRGAGVLAYGIVNLFHILSVATLFGSVLLLDLRLLGAWRRVPLAAIEQPTVRLAIIGFAGAALSGACMISTNATDYRGNPFLVIKFAAMAVALANTLLVQLLPSWRKRGQLPAPGSGALVVAGGISLISWLTVVAAGRMIGYW
jgi:hypothetical protein